ncbi:MAG: hypothetical protein HY293_04410 [Planctomycetes bacterium]|nr:hypothetical protein [Planctomycetota bacterium]
MKTMLAIGVLAFALQGERKANHSFEQLKKLEGSWESGDKEHPCTVTYKLSSGGSALVETMSMGKGDMLTVYCPEGEGLGMTHYCMLGNQPHMKLDRDGKAGTLRFVCEGGTNLKCAADKHMHSLVLTIVDADHLKQDWALYDGGKEQAVHSFSLSRRK